MEGEGGAKGVRGVATASGGTGMQGEGGAAGVRGEATEPSGSGVVGQAMAELTGVREIGSKYGAIGFLTERRMDRDALTEAAVLMAMVPRIRRGLFAR